MQIGAILTVLSMSIGELHARPVFLLQVS